MGGYSVSDSNKLSSTSSKIKKEREREREKERKKERKRKEITRKEESFRPMVLEVEGGEFQDQGKGERSHLQE